MTDRVVGVDVGGTKVAVAVVEGTTLHEVGTWPTDTDNQEELLQQFEDAIRQGIERATRTLRGVSGAYVKDQRVTLEDGRITGYVVHLQITFVLEG